MQSSPFLVIPGDSVNLLKRLEGNEVDADGDDDRGDDDDDDDDGDEDDGDDDDGDTPNGVVGVVGFGGVVGVVVDAGDPDRGDDDDTPNKNDVADVVDGDGDGTVDVAPNKNIDDDNDAVASADIVDFDAVPIENKGDDGGDDDGGDDDVISCLTVASEV